MLVGPPGALVFRILDVEGVYANEKGNWLKQRQNNEWVPARINPTAEDIVDINALREYLAARGLSEVNVYAWWYLPKMNRSRRLWQKNHRAVSPSQRFDNRTARQLSGA